MTRILLIREVVFLLRPLWVMIETKMVWFVYIWKCNGRACPFPSLRGVSCNRNYIRTFIVADKFCPSSRIESDRVCKVYLVKM